jgi:tetrahedral aminopeptidase
MTQTLDPLNLKRDLSMDPIPTNPKIDLPRIGDEQLELLERLCNACAISGDEGEVRAIVREQLEEPVRQANGTLKVDALGNLLVTRPGSQGEPGSRLKVMLAAHMDEVGFMLIADEEKGIFRFDIAGGIDHRVLAGKPVWVGRDRIPGVIGAKAIHLTQPDETRRTISLDNLRIDLGPESGKAKVGDWAAFATRFTRMGPSLRAKALDNRLGVATLIHLVKNAPDHIDLQAAFTVQEEVGLRGARVAAHYFDPDLAIAIDSTPAYDLPHWDDGEPGWENSDYNTRLGYGPAIYLSDSSTISDPRLIRHMVETAEALAIPYQFRQPGGGGTDAGSIHKQRAGIPSLSISVPGRYHHTPAAIVRISDWEHTLALLYAALVRLPAHILSPER